MGIKVERDRGMDGPLKFPAILETHEGLVVLFTKERIGTVLQQGTQSDYPLGHWSNSWSMLSFEMLIGSVKLGNT